MPDDPSPNAPTHLAVFGCPPGAWFSALEKCPVVPLWKADVCLVCLDQADAVADFIWEKESLNQDVPCPVVGCYEDALLDALNTGCDLGVPLSATPAEVRAQISALHRRVCTARIERSKARTVRSKLSTLRQKFDALDSDLDAARRLQQGLIQDRQHVFPGGLVSLLLREQSHIGGDMVGHFPVDETTVGFFAFDVSGHGITSALLIARLTGMVLGTSPATNIALTSSGGKTRARSPAQVLEDLNAIMFDELDTDHYFTAVLGFFNHSTGQVIFCQAGHPHPILISHEGGLKSIGDGGLPIGLIPGAEFQDIRVRLSPGDRMLVISDGITETSNRSRTGQLSEQGLAWLVQQYHDLDALDLFDRLLADLEKFQGHDEYEDDLSAVMLDFRPDDTNNDTAFRSPDTARSVAAR